MTSHAFTMVSAALALALAGCGSGEIYRKDRIADLSSISIDARQRLGFVGTYRDKDQNERRAVCLEPSPDAAVARAAALAAAGATPVPAAGGAAALGSTTASLNASSAESLASIAMRTQTVQLLRDGYYRACEGLLNGTVTAQDYKIIMANIDATMIALAAVDALSASGTSQAPAVTISAQGATSAAAATGTAGGSIQNVFPPAAAMIPAQAEAIKAIALRALEYSRERQLMIWGYRKP